MINNIEGTTLIMMGQIMNITNDKIERQIPLHQLEDEIALDIIDVVEGKQHMNDDLEYAIGWLFKTYQDQGITDRSKLEIL